MKAAVWHARRDIRIEEYPDPKPLRDDEVQIQVSWCGICGTDLEEYTNGPIFIPVERPNPITGSKAPQVLGHEFIGTVVEVGSGVKDLRVGDVVAPDTLIHCGKCAPCLRHEVNLCENLAILGLMTDGGLAEYINAPSFMCFKLPPGVSAEVGALAEPTAVAVRALRRGRIAEGETVAIIGAGTIGLLSLEVARISGAAEVFVIEPAKNRREVACQLDSSETIDPEKEDTLQLIKKYTNGLGVDLVIEAGGTEKTMLMAPQLARRGGRVVYLGVHNEPAPYNFFPMVNNEIELIGSFSHVYDEDFKEAVAHLGDGRIKAEPLITSRISLDDLVEKGLNELLTNKTGNLKILVSPQI